MSKKARRASYSQASAGFTFLLAMSLLWLGVLRILSFLIPSGVGMVGKTSNSLGSVYTRRVREVFTDAAVCVADAGFASAMRKMSPMHTTAS